MTKSAISRQNQHIGTGSESRYRYPLDKGKVVPVPKVGGTSTDQSGAGTDASNSRDFYTFALLSPKFVHR